MPKKTRSDPFTCFYCGDRKAPEESLGEHIVPASIGGTKNATYTTEVCRTCNRYMDKHVDIVFARDYFIENARFRAGIVNRGKEPVLRMGMLNWDRTERASVFVTKKGVMIVLVENTLDNQKRLLVGLDESQPSIVEHTRKVTKSRFSGIPVANDHRYRGKGYEDELTQALMSYGKTLPVSNSMSLVAWHRELVKIALGLSCMALGPLFIRSGEADLLRRFLFEDDSEKRSEMSLRGKIGIDSPDVKPQITNLWHPGGEQHLFALTGTGDGLFFVANLFGLYENVVVISESILYNRHLPGDFINGVCWIVDGQKKETIGPSLLSEVMKENLK